MHTSLINSRIANMHDFVAKVVSNKYSDTTATWMANTPVKARCDRISREC